MQNLANKYPATTVESDQLKEWSSLKNSLFHTIEVFTQKSDHYTYGGNFRNFSTRLTRLKNILSKADKGLPTLATLERLGAVLNSFRGGNSLNLAYAVHGLDKQLSFKDFGLLRAKFIPFKGSANVVEAATGTSFPELFANFEASAVSQPKIEETGLTPPVPPVSAHSSVVFRVKGSDGKTRDFEIGSAFAYEQRGHCTKAWVTDVRGKDGEITFQPWETDGVPEKSTGSILVGPESGDFLSSMRLPSEVSDALSPAAKLQQAVQEAIDFGKQIEITVPLKKASGTSEIDVYNYGFENIASLVIYIDGKSLDAGHLGIALRKIPATSSETATDARNDGEDEGGQMTTEQEIANLIYALGDRVETFTVSTLSLPPVL